ncbi:MAG: purine-nucleoside phosphorylase [Marinifilaceae bacterium]
MTILDEIKSSVNYLRERLGKDTFPVGIVLGTGFGDVVEEMEIEETIPYTDIPCFPKSSVAGHKGNLLAGTIAGQSVLVMQGRFHFYEGHSMSEVTHGIRVMKMLGVDTLLLTNAAGGVNTGYRMGDIMVLNDHINLLPEHPLRGENMNSFGPRFPGMSDAYDANLRSIAIDEAIKANLPVNEGVYAALQGPSYETKAEYKWLRIIGADAVGMSTVPEVIVARHCDIRCLGISLITNSTATEAEIATTHGEVLSVGEMRKKQLKQLLKRIIARL